MLVPIHNDSSLVESGGWANITLTPETNLTTQTPIQSLPVIPSMTFRFVFQTGLCMPLALLGLVGNIISWFVLYRQRPRLTTTVLLMGLAVADSLVLIMTVLLRSIRYLYYYTNKTYGVSYMQYYQYIFVSLYPSVYFIRLVDTWLTVLLTVDRFIAVYRPLHAQGLCTLSKAYKNMFILFVLSLLFSLPRFFEYKLFDRGPYYFVGTSLSQNMTYMIFYQIILFLLIMYIIPMTLLVVLNTKLLVTLQHAETYRASLPRSRQPSRSPNRSVTATVVVVVVVSLTSNIVALISHLLYCLEKGPQKKEFKYLGPYRRYASNISNFFITISCATNFLIYCLCSKNFRMVLMRTFRHLPCCSHSLANSTYNGSLRTNTSGLSNFSGILLRVSTKKKSIHENEHNFSGPITKIAHVQEPLMM